MAEDNSVLSGRGDGSDENSTPLRVFKAWISPGAADLLASNAPHAFMGFATNPEHPNVAGRAIPITVLFGHEQDAAVAGEEQVRSAEREVVIPTSQSRLERLEEALRKIEGGHIEGASTLVVKGEWRLLYMALQLTARSALDEDHPNG